MNKNIINNNSMLNKDISNINKNMMTIIYNINYENKVKLFDEDFIKNNKNNCYLVVNDIKQELIDYLEINTKEQEQLEIKLYETNTITNMYCMFYKCSSLVSLRIYLNGIQKMSKAQGLCLMDVIHCNLYQIYPNGTLKMLLT